MLIIVTDPQALDRYKLGKTLYVIPETLDDAKRYNDYTAMAAEAEEMSERNKYNASLARQAAYKVLLAIAERADFISIDDIVRPNLANFGRGYALRLLGNLFKGNLRREQIRKFNQRTLGRIQKARFALKKIKDPALAARWQRRVESNLTS